MHRHGDGVVFQSMPVKIQNGIQTEALLKQKGEGSNLEKEAD